MLIRTAGLGATSTSGLIAATGSAAGGTFALLATPAMGISALGGPVGMAIGTAVALVSQLLGYLGVGNGCGQGCVTASTNANAIEQQMRDNLAAFQSGQISQAAAEANYQTLWQSFAAMCAQVQGNNSACVTDRQQGACKWKDASGACWNWYTGYYLPIAQAAPTSAASLTSILGTLSPAEWLLIAGLGLGAYAAVTA